MGHTIMIHQAGDIYLGDSHVITPMWLDKSVDCIITDFPYDSMFDLDEMIRICKGNIICFCSPKNIPFKADETLFWIKTPSTKNYKRNCGNFVEMILIKRQGDTFNQLHWSQMTGVYDDKLVYPPQHPYEKPLSLMERLVRIYSNQSDIVFDPFCGSGSTLLAAARLGRKYIGIELNPEYHSLAKLKISGATDK